MPATYTEIAKHAKVSLSLVSRFFNDDPSLRIRQDKRERILSAAKNLGGPRNRKTASRSLSNIVMPITRFRGEKWFRDNLADMPFTQGLEHVLRQHNFHFSITTYAPEKKQDFYRELLDAPEYCGGLFITGFELDEDVANLVCERHFPHVSVTYDADRLKINTVGAHAFNGIRDAIRHLRELGHRRIGHMGPKIRYGVFVGAMVEMGMEVSENLNCRIPWPKEQFRITPIATEWRDYIRKQVLAWLDQKPETTALICYNDIGAFGVLDALKEKGLTPGKDMSVIGYDNVEQRFWNEKEPILTTLDNPTELIGARCAHVLLNQINGKQTSIVHEQLPLNLIVRKTTGPAPEE